MLTYPLPISFLSEELLQFIWLYRYYKEEDLCTMHGDPLRVLHPGTWNRDQGPDFTDARLMIGDLLWVGHIELHLRTSYWETHGHHTDPRYDNVILHVVWIHDKPVDMDHRHLPVLELQPLVANILLQRYALLMHTTQPIPCHWQLPALSELGWLAWTDRLSVERLTRKSGHVLELLAASGNHWEEVFWWSLAYSFGMKVNAAFFEQVARSLPITLLARHKNSIAQLEALLLGQANLLQGHFTEDYPLMLQREYHFLRCKYKLQPLKARPGFLRMRPAAFPTLRLAQLAMLLHKSTRLFSCVREAAKPEDITAFFDVTANDYWHYHYVFDELTGFLPKKPGTVAVQHIMINTVIPVLFAYGMYNGDEAVKERALQWLAAIPKEQNRITRQWEAAGIPSRSAIDTQALIELTNCYCTYKRCLECAVGAAILKAATS